MIRGRALGAFLGLALGDALGAPVEVLAPGTFPEVTGFQPSPRFGLGAGQWTDDTIMRLAPAVIETLSSVEETAASLMEVFARDTHNSHLAAEATVLFGLILRQLMLGVSFEESLASAGLLVDSGQILRTRTYAR